MRPPVAVAVASIVIGLGSGYSRTWGDHLCGRRRRMHKIVAGQSTPSRQAAVALCPASCSIGPHPELRLDAAGSAA